MLQAPVWAAYFSAQSCSYFVQTQQASVLLLSDGSIQSVSSWERKGINLYFEIRSVLIIFAHLEKKSLWATLCKDNL